MKNKYALLGGILILFLLTSCSQNLLVKKIKKIDRYDVWTTAQFSLDAYKQKNVKALMAVVTQENAKILEKLMIDQTLLEGRRLFTNWRWELVNQSQGKPLEIRHGLKPLTVYALISPIPAAADAKTELGILEFYLENNQWCFSDIQKTTKADFEKLQKFDYEKIWADECSECEAEAKK